MEFTLCSLSIITDILWIWTGHTVSNPVWVRKIARRASNDTKANLLSLALGKSKSGAMPKRFSTMVWWWKVSEMIWKTNQKVTKKGHVQYMWTSNVHF